MVLRCINESLKFFDVDDFHHSKLPSILRLKLYYHKGKIRLGLSTFERMTLFAPQINASLKKMPSLAISYFFCQSSK